MKPWWAITAMITIGLATFGCMESVSTWRAREAQEERIRSLERIDDSERDDPVVALKLRLDAVEKRLQALEKKE